MTGFAQVVVVVFKSNTVAEVMEMNKLLAMYKFAKKERQNLFHNKIKPYQMY